MLLNEQVSYLLIFTKQHFIYELNEILVIAINIFIRVFIRVCKKETDDEAA